MEAVARRFYIETLGCPKNQVDSEKLLGKMEADGLSATDDPSKADVIVVNTCAFIEEARRESIDTILALDDQKKRGAKLVVTGCMAERYGDELVEALPEADQIAGFGVAIEMGKKAKKSLAVSASIPEFDLLNLPRPKSAAPWAYVKIAEGCDRTCGFCAIPSFRGPQRSRDMSSILDEVNSLAAQEIVLIAQDLASYGKDRPDELGAGSIVQLVREVSARVPRTRLLYLYPSDLSDELIDAILATGVPYFDLSLQHASKEHLRRMRRWGDGPRFLERIKRIRELSPDAAFRSNFIVGYPGETEEDHDQMIRFVEEADLDWCGFFTYSAEEGTYAATLPDQVPQGLMDERIAELREIQDAKSDAAQDRAVGRTFEVLVDESGVARSYREAPEIDGVIHVSKSFPAGTFHSVEIVGAFGPDLVAAGSALDESRDGDHAR